MFRLAVKIFGGNSFLFASKFLFQLLITASFGLEFFGCFALAQSTVYLVEKFKNIQPWQILTVQIDEDNSTEVFWLFWFYEFSLSFVAFLIFCVFIFFFSSLFNQATNDLVAWYKYYILLSFNGSALGYLRWRSEYNLVLFLHFIFAVIVIFMSLVANKFLFLDIARIYILCEISLFIFQNIIVFYKVGTPSLAKVLFFLRSHFFSHVKTVRITHLNNVIRVLTRELDVVLLGVVATSQVVGSYKLAKNISHLPVFVTDSFYFSIYPDLVRSVRNNDEFNLIVGKATKKSLLFAIAVFACFFCAYLWTKINPEFNYSEVIKYALLFQFPIFICLVTFSWAPALLSKSFYSVLVRANFFGTLLYFLFYYPFYYYFGASGVIIDYFIYYIVWALIVRRYLYL